MRDLRWSNAASRSASARCASRVDQANVWVIAGDGTLTYVAAGRGEESEVTALLEAVTRTLHGGR